MSPVSRGRKVKQKKKIARRSATAPIVLDALDQCDCPSCSGAGLDPQEVIDGLIASVAVLGDSANPLESELVGAAVMAIGARAGKDFEDGLIAAFIPEFEARGTTEALAVLLALGSVADERVSTAASAATARLVQAGVPQPGWAAELGEPVQFAECLRLADSRGTASILVGSFHRAGRMHAIVISVDDQDCGAADDIHLLDTAELSEALGTLHAAGRAQGLKITTETLDAREFRWQVEKALDARAFHDDALLDEELDEMLVSADGPPYPALAVLVRARMKTLPTPDKPPAPHGDEDAFEFTARQMLAQMTGAAGNPFGAGPPAPRRSRTVVPALPPQRRKADRPVPIYQIKVELRGAKPPIWRRLEVPADISLARLHTIIQIAFGWDDSHLHAFETPYGRFANADRDQRAETSATLEQVAPAINSKLQYTYDFGDDWVHDIVVEKLLGRNEAVEYPRCTGGRRAAPPDDCGGVWGYAELLEVLSDPADQEHDDRLEWLGIEDPAEFDPEGFDAHAVTRALSSVS